MARCIGVLFVAVVCAALLQSAECKESFLEQAVGNLLGSLPNSRRRDLLQDGSSKKQGQCVWNADREVCTVNPLVALGLMSKAPDSELKDLILDTVECNFKKDKDTCVKSETCKWDQTHEVCEFLVDVTEIDHFKRCVGDAAVFLETSQRSHVCSILYNTRDSCNIARDCGWEEASNTCTFDLLKVLTGVPSMDTLPRGLDEILLIRAGEMADDIGEADLNKPEDVLSWEPPVFTCPDGVDQVICHVAEQADEYVKIEVFCAAREASTGSCSGDDRCFYDETIEDEELRCRLSKELEAEARMKQRNAYISAISSSAATALLKKDFECLDKTKKQCKEHCNWHESSKRCTMDGQFIVQEISRHPVAQDNPSCELVKEVFSSGCLQYSKEDCGTSDETNTCMWDGSDGLCIPGPLALSDILFRKDDKLKAEANGIIKKCRGIKEESKCL